MLEVKDQMMRLVRIPEYPPRRIISLVPSQTELLCDLGLDNQIVGVTKFCIHPDYIRRNAKKIGGTKSFDFELIDSLKPDLIIGNKEENYAEGIAELEKKYPVWMSDIYTLEDAYSMLEQVGKIVGKTEEAQQLSTKIAQAWSALKNTREQSKVLYFIWKKPYMAVASNTFIHTILAFLGYENVLKNKTRYVELTKADIAQLKPEQILLSSEPFPFKEEDKVELQKLCPEAEIHIVDGEMYSWYGSRLLKAAAYFEKNKR